MALSRDGQDRDGELGLCKGAWGSFGFEAQDPKAHMEAPPMQCGPESPIYVFIYMYIIYIYVYVHICICTMYSMYTHLFMYIHLDTYTYRFSCVYTTHT